MKYDIQVLKDILQMNQRALKSYLELYLQGRGCHTLCEKGFLYVEGQIPVLLVAHLDTVHRQKAEIICFSENNRFVMSPQGIGGDDRCGVYMIMEILKTLPCHALFCEDEEIGGHGAKAFTKSNISPTVNYIIELDRRGSNDAVFYNCHNRAFAEFILRFGFTEKSGTFSDISVIAPHLKTAAVNISSGYFNEHRENEYIDMLTVEYNIGRIIEIIKTETEHFDYKAVSEYENQISMFGDSNWIPMEQKPHQPTSVRKLLMTIPDSAHIVAGKYRITPKSKYMIDKEGKIYVYVKELNAAVETEHVFSCGNDERPLIFVSGLAKQMRVISLDDLIE